MMSETEEIDARRLAIIHVPREFVFFHLFAQPVDGKFVKVIAPTIVYRGKEVDWKKCRVMEVCQDWDRGSFAFKLHSLEFEPVTPGEYIERARCKLHCETIIVPSVGSRWHFIEPPNAKGPTLADIMKMG